MHIATLIYSSNDDFLWVKENNELPELHLPKDSTPPPPTPLACWEDSKGTGARDRIMRVRGGSTPLALLVGKRSGEMISIPQMFTQVLYKPSG